MRTANVILLFVNTVLLIILISYIGSRGLSATPGWEYKDLVSILLTALGAILAGLAIFIGVAAIWGYSAIREAAINAAEAAATTTATEVARSTAETIALRVAETAVSTTGAPGGDEDELSGALAKRDD